jgi:hypothetical protein
VELHVSQQSGVMRLSTPVSGEEFDGVLTSAETQAFLEMSKRQRSRWTASHTNRVGIVKARESRIVSWDHALLTIHKSASPFSSAGRHRGMSRQPALPLPRNEEQNLVVVSSSDSVPPPRAHEISADRLMLTRRIRAKDTLGWYEHVCYM